MSSMLSAAPFSVRTSHPCVDRVWFSLYRTLADAFETIVAIMSQAGKLSVDRQPAVRSRLARTINAKRDDRRTSRSPLRDSADTSSNQSSSSSSSKSPTYSKHSLKHSSKHSGAESRKDVSSRRESRTTTRTASTTSTRTAVPASTPPKQRRSRRGRRAKMFGKGLSSDEKLLREAVVPEARPQAHLKDRISKGDDSENQQVKSDSGRLAETENNVEMKTEESRRSDESDESSSSRTHDGARRKAIKSDEAPRIENQEGQSNSREKSGNESDTSDKSGDESDKDGGADDEDDAVENAEEDTKEEVEEDGSEGDDAEDEEKGSDLEDGEIVESERERQLDENKPMEGLKQGESTESEHDGGENKIKVDKPKDQDRRKDDKAERHESPESSFMASEQFVEQAPAESSSSRSSSSSSSLSSVSSLSESFTKSPKQSPSLSPFGSPTSFFSQSLRYSKPLPNRIVGLDSFNARTAGIKSSPTRSVRSHRPRKRQARIVIPTRGVKRRRSEADRVLVPTSKRSRIASG